MSDFAQIGGTIVRGHGNGHRTSRPLAGSSAIDAGLAALARQIITRKAADDAAQIISMLGIQEES